METSLLTEILLNAGPMAALAAVAFWRAERAWRVREGDRQQMIAELTALHNATLEALQGNTRVLAHLCERLGGGVEDSGPGG